MVLYYAFEFEMTKLDILPMGGIEAASIVL